MLALKQREIGKLDKDEINYIELIIKELTQFASRINSDIKEKTTVYQMFMIYFTRKPGCFSCHRI